MRYICQFTFDEKKSPRVGQRSSALATRRRPFNKCWNMGKEIWRMASESGACAMKFLNFATLHLGGKAPYKHICTLPGRQLSGWNSVLRNESRNL